MQIARQGIRAITGMLIEVSLGNSISAIRVLSSHSPFGTSMIPCGTLGDSVAHCEKSRQAHMRDIHIACVVDVCTLACIVAIG